MDRSAIEAIRDMAALTQDNLDTDIPARIVPNSHAVQSLEHLCDTPQRFRNRYIADDLESFIYYVNENKTDDSVIYVDRRRMQATCIFDHGNHEAPAWGDHVGILVMEPTPEYSALINQDGFYMSQQEFIDWYHDWMPFISFADQNHNNLPQQDAINAIRRLNISMAREASSTIEDFSHEKSAMEKVEVKSTVTLPAEMVFHCHPFLHLEEQYIRCRIAIRADEKPQIMYRIIGLQNMTQSIAMEMSDKIHGGTNTTIYLGTAKHGIEK